MNIIEKIDKIQKEFDLCESGIRNIRKLSKEYNKAIIYFHKDLDGVTKIS